MLQYLAQQGIPVAESTRACGLSITLPPEVDQRVPGSQVERLWHFAVERTGDQVVGLHMTEAYSPGALDIVGYVVLSCRTIGEVLDRLARYAHLLNNGMRMDVVREARTAYCRCTIVSSMDNYLLRRPAEAISTVWAGLARELGRMTATPLAATEVWFAHAPPPPADVREYERVLGARVKFNAPEYRFIMPLAHLDARVLSANPLLLATFEQHADAVLAKIANDGAKSHTVARVLAERLKGAVPPLSEIARELAMSDRNLQRALRNDGTSYQKLLDEVRRDLALRHLANPATSAGQVGFLLGFSEPSAFHRAFRRWTGKAPSAYRATAATA